MAVKERNNMWNLFEEGSVAIVTGGARGIGRAIALELAAQGANVAVNYRGSVNKAESLKEEIESMGRRALIVQADVRERDDVKKLFKAVKKEFGRLDMLVNNAGIIKDGYLIMMSEESFWSVVETNLGGAFRVTQEALQMMCSARKGSIVNIASTSGVAGQEGQTNYSASKGGIIAFSKAVAKEYAKYGIRCNAVAPGFIETDMTSAKGAAETLKDKYMDLIPLGRFGSPEDVANAAAFLLSDRSGYITGKVLTVDGGLIG